MVVDEKVEKVEVDWWWTGWWRWTGGSGRGLVAAERERQLMRELAQPSGRGKYE